MFATQFPDLQWLKQRAESRFAGSRHATKGGAAPGWPTVVLNVKAGNTYRDNIPGPLSLFSNNAGKSYVSVEGRRTSIPEGCYLLSNPGQRYTLEIEARDRTETMNVHFGERWAEDAMDTLTKRFDHFESAPGHDPVLFHTQLLPKNPPLESLLAALLAIKGSNDLRRDELLFEIVSCLLFDHKSVLARVNALAAAKLSTRQEVMRRLHLATDYMYSTFHCEVSLDVLAQTSMLSRFHFLRAFKEAFGETPHQFITGIRIDRAKALLATTGLGIAEVGRRVGFDTASTFSRLFRNRTGLYPTEFRARN